MENQREAVLGYADEQHAYYIRLIENEHTINLDWFYSNALGGVRSLVPENYVDEAKLFLEKDFSDELEQKFGENKRTPPKALE